jgi:hypothetical protein
MRGRWSRRGFKADGICFHQPEHGGKSPWPLRPTCVPVRLVDSSCVPVRLPVRLSQFGSPIVARPSWIRRSARRQGAGYARQGVGSYGEPPNAGLSPTSPADRPDERGWGLRPSEPHADACGHVGGVMLLRARTADAGTATNTWIASTPTQVQLFTAPPAPNVREASGAGSVEPIDVPCNFSAIICVLGGHII